ncbi:hypothetical protein GCM10008018_46120 [Paenibacillus marchantiophytorum]|uniref:Uncharacterized protein n=1 Tax=Paenibacillus marchantiophytorum TaxID=1619310 RepID=A0ABQ1F021_9BACL|nr:hypothetical protein GCM10008018_46120 [Paenibacillus marchantiophytorum]
MFKVKVGGMSEKLDLKLKFTLKVSEDARVLGLVAGFGGLDAGREAQRWC